MAQLRGRTLGPLDHVPPLLRSLLEMMVATALVWAGTDLVSWLEGRGGYAAVLAPFVVAAAQAGTPLTRQYGVGSGKSKAEPPQGRHEARQGQT